MKRLLALLIALIWLPAMADLVASNGHDYVRIQDAPCPAALLALVPPEQHDLYRAAFSHVNAREYRACWTLLPDGRVFLRYEDGDQGLVPAAQFKPVPTL